MTDASGSQETGEIGAVTPEQEQRESGDDRRNLPSFVIHEDVEAEDVHNHWAEQCEARWNVAANQQNQSAENLATGDDVEITGFIHRTEKRASRSGHGRHGHEMQKGVRAEDGEHESKQNTGDDGGDFHAALLNRFGEISTIKIASNVLTSFVAAVCDRRNDVHRAPLQFKLCSKKCALGMAEPSAVLLK